MAALANATVCVPVCGLAASSALSRPSQQAVFGVITPATSLSSRRSSRGVVSASSATLDMDKLVSDIKTLTLEQARTLTDRLQEELGVTASAMMPMGASVGGGAAPAEAAAAVEEQSEFTLTLDEVPSSQRIAVIKVVRALTGLGLKEAKDLIEGLPKNVKEAIGKDDAEDGKKQLEAAGAKCSIK